MARQKKEVETVKAADTQKDTNVAKETVAVKEEKKLPANIDKILRLNKQYKKVYITADGFAHPENAMKVLIETATLYDNPYFK